MIHTTRHWQITELTALTQLDLSACEWGTQTSEFGSVLILAHRNALVKVEFLAQPEAKSNDWQNQATHNPNLPNFADPHWQSLILIGTPFQHKVWRALLTLKPNQTTHYRALATQIGHPKSFRAVGNAVGANPLAMIVPCHRVLRSDGGLGGYRWGTALKEKLLMEEAQACA